MANSPFAPVALHYPHDDPIALLAFNLRVTQAAFDEVCSNEVDPAVLAFTACRIVELGGYSIIDPAEPENEPQIFLAASKQSGYFFTPIDVAMDMAEAALGRRSAVSCVLDPAAGAGALLAATMIQASATGCRISRLLGIEIDSFTSSCARTVLTRVAELIDFDGRIDVETANGIERMHAWIVGGPSPRFDCVVMNPPYGRVKFLRDAVTNAETRLAIDADEVETFARRERTSALERASRLRSLSLDVGIGGGPQDYHRLFTGLALSLMCDDGRVAIISPDSWLGDSDSAAMRRGIVEHRLLERATIYPEACSLFPTVNQPTVVSVFTRAAKSDFRLEVRTGRDALTDDSYSVAYDQLSELDPRWLRVPRIPRELYGAYSKLANHPRVSDFLHLRNARGELDLTIHRSVLRTKPTDLRLVRGDHIERYVLRPPEGSKRESYADPDAVFARLCASPKLEHMRLPRIVGRQCAYQNKKRRLSFTVVPADVLVANSCNYLCLPGVAAGLDEVVLRAIVAVLNSAVIEWYFRIFNSNNHVANYEIADLPLCLEDESHVRALAHQADQLLRAYGATTDGGKTATPIEDPTDALVAHSFGLTPDEARSIVACVDPNRAERVAAMVEALDDGMPRALVDGLGWFQHVPPRLSDLDREMIQHVPQGGNWQSIPVTVPSKRLDQIRRMTAQRGVVRTTYYGRLRPDQPAYTISTYYNRPGNGTNIHPWEDRTLTSREAARLQSFPDWYVFLGSEASVRKQIGNAVPPLLGRAVAESLREVVEGLPSVDLFAGAGGLSLGFEIAGMSVDAAVDSDPDACATYSFNRGCETEPDPNAARTLLLKLDLSDRHGVDTAIRAIERKLAGRELGVLAGGPPCQGFSHAGWRANVDRRNELASVFMDFVEALRPRAVVLENVEGLITYARGQLVRDLIRSFAELGYTTPPAPWLLRAECYGVPQMRRRVFLIAVRDAQVPEPPQLLLKACAGRRERPEALQLDDLPYPVTVAEALIGLPALGPETHGHRGERPVRPYYSKWVTGAMTADALLQACRAN